MSQELIKTLRWLSDYDNNDFVLCANTCMQAADTIQYLLDGADEVNRALREQIEENERLKAEKNQLQETLDMYGGDCGITAFIEQTEKLKAERDAAVADMTEYVEQVLDDDRGNYACHICKNKTADNYCEKKDCDGLSNWKWRGVERKEDIK